MSPAERARPCLVADGGAAGTRGEGRAVRSSLAADVEPVGPRRPLAAQDRYRRARAEPQPVAGPEPCHTWAWIASAHLGRHPEMACFGQRSSR